VGVGSGSGVGVGAGSGVGSGSGGRNLIIARLTVSVSFGHLQRCQAAWVGYKMLYLTGAPHCVQSDLSIMPINCPQAPQCIAQTVVVQDRDDAQWLIVGSGLDQVREQSGPPLFTGRVGADLI
jgi:hypothetical protein